MSSLSVRSSFPHLVVVFLGVSAVLIEFSFLMRAALIIPPSLVRRQFFKLPFRLAFVPPGISPLLFSLICAQRSDFVRLDCLQSGKGGKVPLSDRDCTLGQVRANWACVCVYTYRCLYRRARIALWRSRARRVTRCALAYLVAIWCRRDVTLGTLGYKAPTALALTEM